MVLETRQPDAFAITFTLLGAATVAVALRTILRLKLRQFHFGERCVQLSTISAHEILLT
jgi:hypothetical protein